MYKFLLVIINYKHYVHYVIHFIRPTACGRTELHNLVSKLLTVLLPGIDVLFNVLIQRSLLPVKNSLGSYRQKNALVCYYSLL